VKLPSLSPKRPSFVPQQKRTCAHPAFALGPAGAGLIVFADPADEGDVFGGRRRITLARVEVVQPIGPEPVTAAPPGPASSSSAGISLRPQPGRG